MVQDRPVLSSAFISNLLWGAFRYPTGIDLRSNPTTASNTALLLAVNTSHVQISLLLTKLLLSLTKLSAKFL